jgi:hypothetical protein
MKLKYKLTLWYFSSTLVSSSLFSLTYLLTYLLHGATVLAEVWPPHIFCVRFRDSKSLQSGVISPMLNPPTWRTRVSLLFSLAPPSKSVRHGRSTSSYAATGIALEFIGAHKPTHTATKCFQQGGDTIEGGGPFLAYFPKMKVGLSNQQSVCVSLTSYFWTACYDFNCTWLILTLWTAGCPEGSRRQTGAAGDTGEAC